MRVDCAVGFERVRRRRSVPSEAYWPADAPTCQEASTTAAPASRMPDVALELAMPPAARPASMVATSTTSEAETRRIRFLPLGPTLTAD